MVLKNYCIAIILSVLPCFCIGQNSIEIEKEKPIRFHVMVNTILPNEDKEAVYEKDYGVIILPKNYSQNGIPVPLVIGCHGGGGSVTDSTSQTESYDLYRYLVSIGYAVMDVAGMPETYSKRLKIDHYRCMGSPIAVASYEAAYKLVIKNFNVDTTGCYISGGSNGGLTATNVVSFSNIPAICQANMSPLLSIKEVAWNIKSGAFSGGEFKNYQNRSNIIRIYGMKDAKSIPQLEDANYELDKVGKYDPFVFNMTIDENGRLVKEYHCPLKIWHPIDDHILPIHFSRIYVKAITNSGGDAALVEMEGGGHGPELYGDSIGHFVYQDKVHELKQSVFELASWFGEYSNIKPFFTPVRK